jgi:hypothetical protein
MQSNRIRCLGRVRSTQRVNEKRGLYQILVGGIEDLKGEDYLGDLTTSAS